MADHEFHRRKRRRVAPEDRKRVSVACCNCRRLKEKCDGEEPCERCVKHERTCSRQIVDEPSTTDSENDVERTRLLEAVARHFLGDVALDVTSLRPLVERLPVNDQLHERGINQQLTPDSIKSLSNGSNGEVTGTAFARSNACFIKQLHDHIRLRANNHITIEATEDNSNIGILEELQLGFDRATLPPREIAKTLASTYFEHGQTVTDFVDQRWIESRLDQLYDNNYTPNVKHAASLCSVLLVLAIGAQYSHPPTSGDELHHRSRNDSVEEVNDRMSVSRNFYRAAIALIPSFVHVVDVDAAQAWLLLGRFALGCDSELARTYFEFGVCVAKRSGDSYDDGSVQDVEERRCHIVDVATVWCRHLAALSGKHSDLNSYILGTQTIIRSDVSSPWSIMQRLTDSLNQFAAQIRRLQSCSNSELASSINCLVEAKTDYKLWWSGTPYSEKPALQLDRPSSHFRLLHYLNLIFLGRPFVFASMRRAHHKGFVTDPNTPSSGLVEDAEYAAYGVVDICWMLDQSDGLSRFNYVEYTSCYAAVSLLVTQGLGYRCRLFRNKVEAGMELLKKLTPPNEYFELESLDRRIQEIVSAETDQNVGQSRRASAPTYSSLSEWFRTSAKKRGDCSPNGSFHILESNLPDEISWIGTDLGGFDFTNVQPDDQIDWSDLDCFSPLACNQIT